MLKKLLILTIVASITFSCNNQQKKSQDSSGISFQSEALSDVQKAFMNNLASLCGKSFPGKEVYSLPGRESWADKPFMMHVTICGENGIHIPFHIGEDKSRTWMFLVEENGLRFRHDHRHEDGTPEDQTLYGGFADNTGTAFMQKFPADQYTEDLLDDNISREWRIILTEDLSTFTYELHYKGAKVFAAEFALQQQN